MEPTRRIDRIRDKLSSLKDLNYPLTFQLWGKDFLLFQSVFSPITFGTTEELGEMLEFKEGQNFLEVGTGCGAIAIKAALNGRNVIAIDINPAAVDNAKENVIRHNVQDKVDIREGNLFDCIREEERFDMIFFNIPFNRLEADETPTKEELAFADPGYKTFKKYCTGLKYLKDENSKLLAGLSPTLADTEGLAAAAKEVGCQVVEWKRYPKEVKYFGDKPYNIAIMEIKSIP